MNSLLGNYGNLLVEPLPGLKHDTGLAVEWSFNEHAILNDGLIKFADKPGTMKYVKIEALLPEKTVRDVTLRCRWMAVECGCPTTALSFRVLKGMCRMESQIFRKHLRDF